MWSDFFTLRRQATVPLQRQKSIGRQFVTKGGVLGVYHTHEDGNHRGLEFLMNLPVAKTYYDSGDGSVELKNAFTDAIL